MGARPVANLNALRFGSPANPRTKHIVDGVVRGIGGYGNCVGVPTVGGEVNFHPAYDGNPLVNAMTVGIAPADRIFTAKATGAGNPVVYVGSKTGRDGIHGATMASAEFSADLEEKRPTVQIGDPFTEKLLIEACLELMQTDAIVAIQDMGAAGLTSSSVEMAGKGGMGIELELDSVPQRESGMTAYEMMLSELQERMLMVLHPGREAEAERIFHKWELDFAVIGHLTDTGRIVIRHKGAIEADIPLAPLESEAPLYRRPTTETPKQPPLDPATIPDPLGIEGALLTLVACPDLCSRRWIWDQYDSMVGGQTARRPGAADAAVVRIEDHRRALALTTDVHPALLPGRPRDRRRPGRRRSLAQPHRHRRPPARHHRQHELRQPRAPGDHGPVRRLHPRHGRRLHRARLPRRLRQRLPLQRDPRRGRHAPRHPAHPGHRRRRRTGGRGAGDRPRPPPRPRPRAHRRNRAAG